MKLLPSPRRNRTGARYSCGSDMRPSIFPSAQALPHPRARASAVMAVLTCPGLIVLTLIGGESFGFPHSAARLRASCSTAAFEQLYAAVGKPYQGISASKWMTSVYVETLTLLAMLPLMLATKTILPGTLLAWK